MEPLWPVVVNTKMPSVMNPKWDSHEGAVEDADEGEPDDDRRVEHRCGREDLQAVPDHAEGADLVEDADQQDRGARLGLGGRVGQPGVEGPQRRLHREGEEEAEEQQLLHVGVDVQPGEGQEVEGPGAGDLRGHHVQADQRGQHEQAAHEAVQQELHGSVGALHAAVAPDHEVDRDQHDLEEHVEQEDVGGDEDADHERLEDEDQGEVALDAAAALLVDVVPAGEDDDRHQGRGQRDQHQADAVDAHRVGDAERRDPRVRLDELEALGGVRAELQGHRDGQAQGHEREQQRHLLGQRTPPPREEGHDDAADERHHHQRGQPGKGTHDALTRTRARTTKTAPPTIDNAYERANPVW